MTEWTLWARDSDCLLVDKLDVWSSLHIVMRHNEAGSWTLTCPRSSLAGQTLATDANQAGGIVLRRDGDVVFSGWVTQVDEDARPESDMVTFSGSDDTALLGTRICLPDPWYDPSADPVFSVGHDTRTGRSDQVMAEYVDANLGPAASENTHGGATFAHPERRLDGLVVPRTGGFGDTITYQARFVNLLAVCQDIAVMGGGLRFKIIHGPVAGERSFICDAPDDLSDAVVFTKDFRNLIEVQRSESVPTVNYAWTGGQGEQEQRTIQELGNSTSIANYGRYELFLDQRQTDDSTVLNQALLTALENGREDAQFSFSPSTTLRDQFGSLWNLGDIVSVQIDTVRFTGYISQIALSVDAQGTVTIVPTVTTALLNKAVRSAIAVLNRRLSFLETSEGNWTPGTVIMWDRAIGDAPAGWALCDGSSGTHDFTGRSPIGVGAVPGGGPTIAVGGADGAYSQSVAAHHHPLTAVTATAGTPSNTAGADDNGTGARVVVAGSTHLHAITVTTPANTSDDAGTTVHTLHPVLGIYFLKRIAL